MSEINPGESLPDEIIKGLLAENARLQQIIKFYSKYGVAHPLTTMIMPKESIKYFQGPDRGSSGWKFDFH